MNSLFLKISLLTVLLYSCNSNKKDHLQSQWKEEIRKTEEEFATLLKEKGIHEAFVAYADTSAVIMRNNELFIGKVAIDQYYKNANSTSLSWSPNFIEVSKSGDLGYTYGTYRYTYNDSLGNKLVDTGIFHTVWKRQENGTWKFVWD